jgi:divalent metal cation (Fe/Co/Zn/Cd) transporter
MSAANLYLVRNESTSPARAELLRKALRLEVISVVGSLLEGAVAIAAAMTASSVVLVGFGADSFVESASALLMLWRLARERRVRDAGELARLEGLARRLIAGSLLLLAAYVAVDAIRALATSQHPRFSPAGAVLLVSSMTLMMTLARAKRRVAAALDSRALAADAFQTTACWWLSAIALAGIVLNALWGWWWADPLAALGAAALIAREARRTWRGEDSCCAHHHHHHHSLLQVPALATATPSRSLVRGRLHPVARAGRNPWS